MENLNFVYHVCAGDPPEKARLCMERNEHFLKLFGVELKVFNFNLVPGVPPCASSILKRLEVAGQYENVLYCDWDVLLIDIPPVNPNHPAFGLIDRDMYDIFIFYNGTNTHLFRDFSRALFDAKIPLKQGFYYEPLNSFFHGLRQTILGRFYHHYFLKQGREKWIPQ